MKWAFTDANQHEKAYINLSTAWFSSCNIAIYDGKRLLTTKRTIGIVTIVNYLYNQGNSTSTLLQKGHPHISAPSFKCPFG